MSALAVLLVAALGGPGFSESTSPSSVASNLAVGVPTVRLEAPRRFVEGEPFPIRLQITAPEDGTPFAAWLVTPAAFSVDGRALLPRADDNTLQLPRDAKLTVEYDLGRYLLDSSAYARHDFKLGYAEGIAEVDPITVACYEQAAPGLDFMALPAEELGGYQVLLVTDTGEMQFELWPDVAPAHVRNFLDLCYVGFYDGTAFHRVKPGFMIQGGDPTGTGAGSGPRKVPAEFSDRKHVRGVLSMARGPEQDSASCQFFVMHAATPGIDGQYSVFGKQIFGLEVLDEIANTPGRPYPDGTLQPSNPPRIQRARVLRPLGKDGR